LTEKVDEFANENIYAGFTRRFLGPRTKPNLVFELTPPKLKGGINSNDDFSHAANRVEQLLGKIALDYSHVTEQKRRDLKNQLLKQQKNSGLTWHELWASVCDLYYP
jgi:hypothetical protein